MPLSPRLSGDQYREGIKAWFVYNKEASLLTLLPLYGVELWNINSFRCNEDHLSLQLIDGLVITNSCSDSYDEGVYDKDLSLDECTVDRGNNSAPITGQMDICLHPVYQVPCPYIVITDVTHGHLISMSDMNNFFDRTNSEKSYKFIQEEHPVTGTPTYTLQLCGVVERFEQICSDITVSNNKNAQHIIYFTSFLSLIVEAVGLKLRGSGLR